VTALKHRAPYGPIHKLQREFRLLQQKEHNGGKDFDQVANDLAQMKLLVEACTAYYHPDNSESFPQEFAFRLGDILNKLILGDNVRGLPGRALARKHVSQQIRHAYRSLALYVNAAREKIIDDAQPFETGRVAFGINSVAQVRGIVRNVKDADPTNEHTHVYASVRAESFRTMMECAGKVYQANRKKNAAAAADKAAKKNRNKLLRKKETLPKR